MSSTTKTSFARIGAITLAGLFIILYLVQIASPLRMNTDAYRFLSMAFSAVEGHGFLVDGQSDVYPEGYPVLLGGMIRLGFGSSVWINALNILCVLAGAAAFHHILQQDPRMTPGVRLILVLLPLASWVCVKHATIPLSENPYLGLSYATLLVLTAAWRETGWKAVGSLVIALLMALAAFRVRSIGLSLVLTTCATAVVHPQMRAILVQRLPRSIGGRIVAGVVVLGVIGAGAFLLWKHQMTRAAQSDTPSYLLQQKDGAANGLPALMLFTVKTHMQELGEFLFNIPQGRIPALQLLFLPAGATLLALCLAGFRPLARRFPSLAIYAVVYAGIVFIWPFYDPRFWLPLAPVMGLCGWLAVEPWWERPVVRWCVRAYAAIFLAVGLAALVFSTRISLSGTRFPSMYGDGTTRDTYQVAFGQAAVMDAPDSDPRWVSLLHRLEPLAQGQPER